MVLDASLIDTQQYKGRIKGKWSKEARLLLHLDVVAIEMGAFWSPSTTVANFTYIYIFINTELAKAWTAMNWLLVIWKSELTDKIKHSFFQAAVVSILQYGCTTWTLTKRMEKKLDDNYRRMLQA